MRLIYSLLIVVPLWAQTQVDAIWSARYVVTQDAARRVIENGAVAVQGDHIVAAGPRADIDRAYRARTRLDRPDAILSPGFIKTPTPAAMSLFRGVPADL